MSYIHLHMHEQRVIFSRVSSKISEKYLSLRLCKVNNVQVVWKSDLLLSRACSSRW